MQKIIIVIIITMYLLGVVACGPINYKGFTYYKGNPLIPSSFPVDGCYYKLEKSAYTKDSIQYWANIYFFYKDGSFFSTDIRLNDSLQKLNEKILNVKNIPIIHSRNCGFFAIRDDSIFIQNLVSKSVGLYSMDVVEAVFLIDGKRKIIKEEKIICNWCKSQFQGFEKDGVKILNPPIDFIFLPLSIKPDSTKIWIKNKIWYKKKNN